MIVVARWLALCCCRRCRRRAAEGLRGTGDLGMVVERATGSVLVVETSARHDARPGRGHRRSSAMPRSCSRRDGVTLTYSAAMAD